MLAALTMACDLPFLTLHVVHIIIVYSLLSFNNDSYHFEVFVSTLESSTAVLLCRESHLVCKPAMRTNRYNTCVDIIKP